MPPRKPLPVPTSPSEDHRRRLIALRDRLTAELDTAPASYVAGIARQLQAVLAEVAAMPDADAPPDFVAELRARREARRAADA